MDESALIQGLRDQDPAAVQHLTECYLPTVWRFVYAKVNQDQHLAEDIVSETVLALIKAVADPDADIRNPGGWLRTVASNKVTDHFRAASRVQHLIDEAQKISPVSDTDDAVKQQELVERRAEIREVMGSLAEQTRMALEWKYVDKVSVREIAERLGTTEKAAESILFRGRKEFREHMVRRDMQNGTLPAGDPANHEKGHVKGNNGRAVSGQSRSAEETSGANAEPDDRDSAEAGAGHESFEAAKAGRS